MNATKLARRKFSTLINSTGQMIYTEPYNGQVWSTDSYFAVADKLDVTSKRTDVRDSRPDITRIVECAGDYVTAKPVKTDQPVNQWNDQVVIYQIGSENVNGRMVEAFLMLPDIEFKYCDEYIYNPIKVYQNNKLIGLIMPLRK